MSDEMCTIGLHKLCTNKYLFFFSSLQLHMTGATEECNEKHLTPWSQACSRDGISNTPLSPYLDKELLYNNHLHIDGSKIEKTGFSYTVPMPSNSDRRLIGWLFFVTVLKFNTAESFNYVHCIPNFTFS